MTVATDVPAIDVVIPVFNGAGTVESAIGSIQAQTLADIRIIVVDDGSTDDTAALVARMAGVDRRIVLLRRANGGIVDALNAGLAACTAPLVARHDADDLAAPDRFERQAAFLRANPGVSAVSGAVRHIDENGRVLGSVLQLASPDLADLGLFPQREPYLMHPFLMMRREAAVAAGGYRHVFHAEDTDLYWRLQETGGLANMPDVLGEYRIHAGSVTGLSPLNGRISAVNSQRAGLSAMRRRAGRPDLLFPKEMLATYKAAQTLEAVIAVGSRDLDAQEAARLRVSACAKLLELAGYRPYELDAADCALIGHTLIPALSSMPADSRGGCIRMLSGTAARLLARGQVGAAMQLTTMRLVPHMAIRFALRTAIPTGLRRLLQRAAGKAEFVK